MSRYINAQIKKIEVQLKPFLADIVFTEERQRNSQGYGYLSSGRSNTHFLKDGTYIEEGLSFSPSKAATIPYFNRYDAQDNLIR